MKHKRVCNDTTASTALILMLLRLLKIGCDGSLEEGEILATNYGVLLFATNVVLCVWFKFNTLLL